MKHSYHIGAPVELLLIITFLLAIFLYIGAGVKSSTRSYLKKWPASRYAFWIFGVISASTAVVGPLAARAHSDFTAHMVGHLLLGMLAPLLLVLAAPMTLLLRTLSVTKARQLAFLLKSPPVRTVSHPIVASILNIGGLWVLYTTDLYAAMQANALLHLAVHIHVFLAGYVFTAAMIYIDPAPHRLGFVYRTVVFIIALAGHAILSKYIYAHPPNGVPAEQAEEGGMLMYYGGDAIDLVLICILCFQWYKSTRPRAPLSAPTRKHPKGKHLRSV
ncbi:cytochrome c oxidase assembly protein [Bacillus sp. B190/17]|uniref:Cytochrome c oxidase assembly protein n=1 Tax=Bacillus lumedeiriae TaxID=3058829 RepID=A0ABW8IDA5_9BACI